MYVHKSADGYQAFACHDGDVVWGRVCEQPADAEASLKAIIDPPYFWLGAEADNG